MVTIQDGVLCFFFVCLVLLSCDCVDAILFRLPPDIVQHMCFDFFFVVVRVCLCVFCVFVVCVRMSVPVSACQRVCARVLVCACVRSLLVCACVWVCAVRFVYVVWSYIAFVDDPLFRH